jgi:hypothetical protein
MMTGSPGRQSLSTGEAPGRRAVEAGTPDPVTQEAVMLLVPRQLARVGMTGDVPYYGGRLTPAQAAAAAHPRRRPPPAPAGKAGEALAALQALLDSGVITADEYRRLRARVTG